MPTQLRARSSALTIIQVSLLVVFVALMSFAVRTPMQSISPLLLRVPPTVLPAHITPGNQASMTAEYGARVIAVLAREGASVHSGDILVTLESSELLGLVEAAERRMDVTKARLLEAQRAEQSHQARETLRERTEATRRDYDASAERLNAFSLKTAEMKFQAAHERTKTLRQLVEKSYATAPELENAVLAEQAASTDLANARDHLSRLRQETAAAESRLRLLEIEARGGSPVGLAVATAKTEYDDARSALNVARQRITRLQITAPFDGIILEVPPRVGDIIAPGTLVTKIADLSRLTISVPVTARVAQKVDAGSRVIVRLPMDPPREIEATVRTVNPAPDATRHAYVVQVEISNPDSRVILVGLEAEVEFPHSFRQGL